MIQDKLTTRGKVLIADDDEDGRMMLAFLLTSEGWDIIEACNGKEAVKKVVEERPDVLLLDNRMPELSGTLVYQHLCEVGLSLPTVLITAYSEVEELALSLGIRYFLKKPIDFQQLLTTLEAIGKDF